MCLIKKFNIQFIKLINIKKKCNQSSNTATIKTNIDHATEWVDELFLKQSQYCQHIIYTIDIGHF